LDGAAEVESLTSRVRELEGLAEKRLQELRHFTIYDQNTGLPTRSLFQDRFTQVLARSKRNENIVAMLSITVEMVKRVRETMGPQYGDQLIAECGKRLTDIFRLEDTVAMMKDLSSESSVSALSETEFGVLVTDLKQIDHVSWIVKRVLDSFEKPFVLEKNEIFASVNIGISIFPHDGETAEELQKNAGAAGRHAGADQGRNKYRFYSKEINEASLRHLQVEGNLRRAIENEELLLHYQPKVDITTGRISGMEALIRWTNPQIGHVSPLEFIPIAERSGQIEKIGEWVFSSACRQLRLWRDMGFENITMAVNFSAMQFRQNNLVERILSIVDEHAISSHSIEIELTETAMMHGSGSSINALKELKQHGFRLAIDDFGTGYSSLDYLKNIPLSTVKIPRSFVKNIETEENSARLLLSIINMAHGLGFEVVAEGVEDQAQAKILTGFNCDHLQGFFFSKPLPESEATDFLKTGPVFSLAQNIEIL
jgi:diguanylate cyclase (GGDEF)-like protein